MHPRKAILVALFLATAGLAGCVGGEDTGQEAGPASESDPQDDPDQELEENTTDQEQVDRLNVTVEWFNGTAQGQAIPGLGPTCFSGQVCDNTFSFNAPNGTTALMAEMAWNRSTSLSLDLDVPSDACEASFGEDCRPEAQSGQSPVVVELTDASNIPPGEWGIGVYAEDSPAEPTEFTIAVSIFEDGEPPRDYAKLAGQG